MAVLNKLSQLLGYKDNQVTETKILKEQEISCSKYAKITLSNEKCIELTLDHPIYTDNGWKSIEPSKHIETAILLVGDKVLTVNAEYVSINNIEIIEENITSYEYTTDTSNYFYNNILVHNASDVEKDDTSIAFHRTIFCAVKQHIHIKSSRLKMRITGHTEKSGSAGISCLIIVMSDGTKKYYNAYSAREGNWEDYINSNDPYYYSGKNWDFDVFVDPQKEFSGKTPVKIELHTTDEFAGAPQSASYIIHKGNLNNFAENGNRTNVYSTDAECEIRIIDMNEDIWVELSLWKGRSLEITKGEIIID